MQHIKEIPPLDEPLLKELSEKVLKDKREFNNSLLYDPHAQTKVEDSEIRTSEFRLFTEPELFDLVDRYLQIINQMDTEVDYLLMRNDLTHIRYQAGGFFKAHSDYLSYTSNVVDEYTMIIALNTNNDTDQIIVGGETIFHFNKFFQHASKYSTTPLHSIIFRKDIIHEGAPLVSGTKDILTMNLLAISKKDSYTIVITFPKHKSKQFYLLSLQVLIQFPNNLILAKLRFTKELDHQNQPTKGNKLIYYVEAETSPEDFEIIAKIGRGEMVNMDEVEENRELIDYYQLEIHNLLANSIVSKKTVSKAPSALDTAGVTIYGSVNEFNFYLEKVKADKLPLMPFVMVWMEGIVNATSIDLTPGYLAFSEYQNVMYLCKFSSNGVDQKVMPEDYENDFRKWLDDHIHPPDDAYGELNLFKLIIDDLEFGEDGRGYYSAAESDDDMPSIPGPSKVEDCFAIDDYHIRKEPKIGLFYLYAGEEGEHGNEYDTDTHGIVYAKFARQDYYNDFDKGFNASLFLELGNTLSELIQHLLVKKGHDNGITSLFSIFYPVIENSQYRGPFYNLDSDGTLCLEHRHLKLVKDKMKEIDLVKKVKALLPTVKIETKQKGSYDDFMCNEQIYGSTTLVAIWGFMRM